MIVCMYCINAMTYRYIRILASTYDSIYTSLSIHIYIYVYTHKYIYIYIYTLEQHMIVVMMTVWEGRRSGRGRLQRQLALI